MNIKAALIALTCLAVSPAWSVNKCTVDGQVVFQDAPCPGGGVRVADDMAVKKAAQEQQRIEAERALAERQATQSQRLQVCKGKIHDEPLVGMTTAQWQNCTDFWDRAGWGKRVNQTETAGGVRRQHVFETGSIKYVYTTNGVITAIQR